MKKYKKIVLFVLIIGIGICFFGYTNGGMKKIYYKNNEVIVEKPEEYFDKFHTSKIENPFNRISLDLFYTSVEIKRGTKYQAILKTNRPVKKFKVEGDTLLVLQARYHYDLMKHGKPKLIITIPEDKFLEELRLIDESTLMDLEIINSRFKEIYLPPGAEVQLNQVEIMDKIENRGGKLTVRNSSINRLEKNGEDVPEGYEFDNSTIKELYAERGKIKDLTLKNSKILETSKLSGDISKLTIKNSELNNCEWKIGNVKGVVQDTTFLGKNAIQVSKRAVLNLSRLNKDLDFSLSGKSKTILLDGKSLKEGFEIKRSKHNFLRMDVKK